LYLASTLFHAICASPRSSLHLQRFDHASIYLLIAGSYTPICVISLDKPYGYELLAVVWTIGLAGILATLFVRHFPKWISAVIYIAMGWMAAFSLPRLAGCLTTAALSWLVAGGIVYTIGGIIYALKMENFNRRHPNFGNHEIFHLFVMAGSFCHFVMMFLL
jgi:hemolysin III